MLSVSFFQRNCILSILLFLIIGCQNTATTEFTITRGVIENHSKEKITDIKIMHLPTHAVATFSGIFSGTTAEIGFQEKKLLAQEAHIIWKEGSFFYKKVLKLPQYGVSKTVVPQKLVYSIFTGGQVTVKLVNDL